MPKSVERWVTNLSISVKLPGSHSRATRSRAVSLPALCWRSTRSGPPPASARRSSSARRSNAGGGAAGAAGVAGSASAGRDIARGSGQRGQAQPPGDVVLDGGAQVGRGVDEVQAAAAGAAVLLGVRARGDHLGGEGVGGPAVGQGEAHLDRAPRLEGGGLAEAQPALSDLGRETKR